MLSRASWENSWFLVSDTRFPEEVSHPQRQHAYDNEVESAAGLGGNRLVARDVLLPALYLHRLARGSWRLWRRLGKPEEVAAAIDFFLSDDASFITGQILYVCGGMSVGHAPI